MRIAITFETSHCVVLVVILAVVSGSKVLLAFNVVLHPFSLVFDDARGPCRPEYQIGGPAYIDMEQWQSSLIRIKYSLLHEDSSG